MRKQWRYYAALAGGFSFLLLGEGAWSESMNDSHGLFSTQEAIVKGLQLESPPPPIPPNVKIKEDTRGIVPKVQCQSYQGQISGQGTPRGIRQKSIPLHIVFATNSAELTPNAQITLDTLVNAFKTDALRACCFLIEGHTDSKGNPKHNMRLSKQRAESVRRYLDKNSESEGRTITAGYGQTKPLAPNDTEEGRQQNRRVQVTNLGYGEYITTP